MSHLHNQTAERPGLHSCARNGAPVSAVRPLILTERPDVASTRISRKRWVRSVLEQRGEGKQDYIAAVLGVSRQYVARCLSEHHRDEFSDAHLARLGLSQVAA